MSNLWAISPQKQTYIDKHESSAIEMSLLFLISPVLIYTSETYPGFSKIPMISITLVLSICWISLIEMKLKPAIIIDGSFGTSTMSAFLSNTKQKSFLIEVNF